MGKISRGFCFLEPFFRLLDTSFYPMSFVADSPPGICRNFSSPPINFDPVPRRDHSWNPVPILHVRPPAPGWPPLRQSGFYVSHLLKNGIKIARISAYYTPLIKYSYFHKFYHILSELLAQNHCNHNNLVVQILFYQYNPQ